MPQEPPSPQPRKKRRCTSTDADDAAIAELLLGLSHSPRSSPRDSNASEGDTMRLSPLSSSEVVSKTQELLYARRSSRRVGRQPLKYQADQPADSEEEVASDESLSGSSMLKGSFQKPKVNKEVPVRCKCGKRVSASHPPCKSELMLLSEKFRDRFASSEGAESRIDLNDCALALGVPRRRLYDITIVYEAAEVVRRTGKLAYMWQGLSHLPDLIKRLKHEEETGLPVGDRRGNLHCSTTEHQNTNSLWTLSRKFIRLLLTRKGVIQLSDAAVHLIGEKQGTRPQTYLTVERRLYDIGSILSTLDLIKRTYIEGKRQPAFSWNWSSIAIGDEFAAYASESVPEQILAPSNVANSPSLPQGQSKMTCLESEDSFSPRTILQEPFLVKEGNFQEEIEPSTLLPATGYNNPLQPALFSQSSTQAALLQFLQQCSALGKTCTVRQCSVAAPNAN